MVYTYIQSMVFRKCGAQCISLRLSLSSAVASRRRGESRARTKQFETLSLELPARLKQADLQALS